jgi:hypothetical protein
MNIKVVRLQRNKPKLFIDRKIRRSININIRIKRKYKILNDGTKYKELKCKEEITNLKKGYSSLIKALKLINIKENIKLTHVEDNKTELDIKIKINISIPNKDDFENYIKIIFQNITDNLVKKLLA